MNTKKRGLGRGIDSLIPPDSTKKVSIKAPAGGKEQPGGLVYIKIDKVEPDRDQPRQQFDEDELNGLADSIRKHGIFQPLIVQKKDDYYEIVAGERRWRAAKIVDLKEVPCIIKEYTEQEKEIIQLLENTQRADLNPIEEALTYRKLIDKYNMTQDDLADTVGKNRTTITNSMRLLNLDEEVQEMIKDEKITPGHARALLGITDKEVQVKIAYQVFDEKQSVRETEKLVKSLGRPKKPKKMTPEALQLIYKKLEDQIREKIGAKVIIKGDQRKGKIEIEYFSQEELEQIVDKITKGEQ